MSTRALWVGCSDQTQSAVVVPAHLGLVTERDVVDVDEHLVAALLVPDLAAGVAGVLQDRSNGELRPGAAAGLAVAVPGGVMGRGRRDAVGGEALGDRVQAVAGEELVEDALHDGSGDRVGLEAVQSLADRGLPGFGCGPASAST